MFRYGRMTIQLECHKFNTLFYMIVYGVVMYDVLYSTLTLVYLIDL